MTFRAVSLQSGSNGNAIFVQAGEVALLFDAGISGRQAELRLREKTALDIRDVTAMFISHDHRDHITSAGIFQRKFDLPMHVSAPTLDAARSRHGLGRLGAVEHFTPGQVVRIGAVHVETYPTPHDGVDGCCFVVEYASRRLGVMTDLGHAFSALGELIAGCDAVYLESNYDAAMLAAGSYPEFLKARIRGPGGHISNDEAAELLTRHGRRLQWAALAHLSADNNTPAAALATARRALGEALPVHLAGRDGPGLVLDIE